MSNAAALRPEGGKQSGETSAQRRRERPNPGRLPAKRRQFRAGRGHKTRAMAAKGRGLPPEKNGPRRCACPLQGRSPRKKAAFRPPAPMGRKDIPSLLTIRAEMAGRMPQKEKG